jgi:F-type H+-transporting ATPase subunit b
MSDRMWRGRMKGRHWASLAMICMASFVPSILWAAGGGDEELESGFTLAMRAVNFILLAGLLYYLLKKPIRNFLDQRQQGVREALEEAQRARQEAEARYKEMERKLAQASKEMEELKGMLVEQGRVEKEKILTNARREAEKIRRQAELAVEQELKKAQQFLREEAVELATQLAEALLKERIESKDHERLITDYVESLGKTA